MKISTRGRYSLRVMADLARQGEGKYVPLKDVVERQGVSQKYAESIMADLSKAGIVEGVHGKGGGYKLTKAPEDYSLGEILRVTEGDLAPITCLEQGAPPCERAERCETLAMWKKFYALINDFFDGTTLADIL